VQTFLQDIRYGIRRFKKDPAFMVVTIVTLALGIGATSAIFSVVNGVLLRPLPFPHSDRVVLLMEQTSRFSRFSVSYQNFVDWRAQAQSYESVAAVRNTVVTLSGIGEPERLPAQMATGNLFNTLGVNVTEGRTFSPEEDRAGGPGVVLISHSLWQRRFGGAQDIIGRSLTLDDKPYTVIGVLPRDCQVLLQIPDVVLPFEPWAKTLPDDRAWHPGIVPIARLKPGVSLEQARSELTGIAQALEKQYPIYNAGTGAFINPIQDQMVENARPALLVLMGAVGLVLLIACTNVANLLLANSAGRQQEFAVCRAMGASRLRILRQLLTESVWLSLASAILGLLLAWAAVPALVGLAGSSLPFGNRVSIDWSVLLFTIAVAMLAGLLFGLAPLRYVIRMGVPENLNERVKNVTARTASMTRSGLVVTQLAVAVLLLVGAGLLLHSFERLTAVAPGFTPDHILVADIPLSPNSHGKPNERVDFYERVLQQTAVFPGVRTAAACSLAPVSGTGASIYFNIKGRPPKNNQYALANYRAVSTNYFAALQVPLQQGRPFQDTDREDHSAVVIINSTLARTFFPNQSPIGQYMQVGGLPDDDVPWMEIVGVVSDVKQALSTEAPAEYYMPYRQSDKLLPVQFMSMIVRTESNPMALASSLRQLVHQIDPNQPVTKIRTMEDNIADSVSEPRFRTVLLTLFAGIALALAGIGIFSVMAYTVTQRTREIGVRVALGASRSQIFGLTLGHTLRLTLIGIMIGVATSFVLTRYVSAFLFEVPSYDLVTLIGTAIVIVLVAIAASYLPARRATGIDPARALRQN
jgi:putative ABC transport system permease protein